MPGTFAYTKATNIIVVTDGTSGAPATFNDMYTADLAGTVTLLAAWAPISSTKALTYQLTPAGAKGLKIDFTVASKTAEADYIFITGTNIDGGAQTESLDVTAGNGTYTTTKWFATITNIDCSDNAAGGGAVWADGTVAVVQNQWGIVWEIVADNQYKIDCDIQIGDGSTATYFTSLHEEIYFSDAHYPYIKAAATLCIGAKPNTYGISGSYWSINPPGISLSLTDSSATATMLLYGSVFESRSDMEHIIRCNVTSINSKFVGRSTVSTIFVFSNADAVLNLTRTEFAYINYTSFKKTPAIAEDILFHDCIIGPFAYQANATISNSRIVNCTDEVGTYGNVTATFINPNSPITTLIMYSAGDAIINQYTCNVHVSDEDGIDLASVVVDCEYAHLVEGSDSKTYKCIADHIAVDATHKPITGTDWATYWELYSATGGYGDWNTGFAYKSGTAEWAVGTVSTDANGDIAEQIIQYKKWTTTSELEEARIHKFTLTYGGDTHVVDDFTVDHPIVWHLEFPPMATLLSAIYAATITNAAGTDIAADIIALKAETVTILADTNEIQGKLPTNKIMGSSDVDNHDTDIDSILADTNEIQGKLPTNNIMGSSVKTDKDDEIDAILVDTNEIQGKLPDEYIMGSSTTESMDDEINTILANINQVHVVDDTTPHAAGGGGGSASASGIKEGC